MIGITPYLMFNGNCEEAMNFYKNVFSGEFGNVVRYSEMPGGFDEEYKNKIMHMVLKLPGSTIMASDFAPGVVYTLEPEKSGVQLSLNFDSTDQMEKAYKELSNGGMITSEIQDTFWGERFAMVTDKYGFKWMLSSKITVENEKWKMKNEK